MQEESNTIETFKLIKSYKNNCKLVRVKDKGIIVEDRKKAAKMIAKFFA